MQKLQPLEKVFGKIVTDWLVKDSYLKGKILALSFVSAGFKTVIFMGLWALAYAIY